MNVLLIPIGSAGDVNPFVAIGLALQARGHRVTMITNGHFEAQARRVGFDFELLGTAEEYDAVVELPDLWDPVQGFRIIMRWAVLNPLRITYELIKGRNIPRETVVVAPATAFGARVAQEKLGVPLVSIALQPAMFRSLTEIAVLSGLPLSSRMPPFWNRFLYWASDLAVIDRLIGPETNAFRAELGLPPVRRFFNGWWFSPQRIIGLFPNWFAPQAPDWPAQLKLTGFPQFDDSESSSATPELDEFLGAGDPPIVFTPGSAMRHGKTFFNAAAEACDRLGRRGILVSRYADQIPESLPDGVRSFDFVRFSRLFPRAAAVVHHGGMGTAAQGLAAGVPQLVMPMAHDQHDNAARLEQLGVGLGLHPRRFRGPAVASALDRLIQSTAVADQCRRAADHLRHADPIPETCRLIEQAGRSSVNRLIPS